MYIQRMSKDGNDLGHIEFDVTIKTPTFKQLRLEQLIKDGTVIPASQLAEAKELALQRARDFEAALVDEGRHRGTAIPAPEGKLKNLPLTRERFEGETSALALDSAKDSFK